MNFSRYYRGAFDPNIKIYEYEKYWIEEQEAVLYDNSLVTENIVWLYKLEQLCKDNNIELLLTKVPVVHSPIDYRSAWTEKKYNTIKRLCSAEDISFFDLLYDVQIEIDWDTDTCDSGMHLNFLGAEKASDALGEYLVSNYNLTNNHYESWDRDLEIYQEVSKIAHLKMEEDFNFYLNRLKELRNANSDICFLIAAFDDMSGGLSIEDKYSLSLLGIKTSFEDAYRDSYISLIKGNEIEYENLSNRVIEYKKSFDTFSVELKSAGGLTGGTSSIKINEKEYAIGQRGINIVVYDVEKDIVLDSVCFDTAIYEHVATRNGRSNFNRQREYEAYLIENSY